MKRARRSIPSDVITRIPDTAMFANKNVDIPPNTGSGITVRKAPNFPKIPYKNIYMPHEIPAGLAATLVKEMIPIF